jgi:uncharacterized SAM-binding protein YcdF (DUF218 family)
VHRSFSLLTVSSLALAGCRAAMAEERPSRKSSEARDERRAPRATMMDERSFRAWSRETALASLERAPSTERRSARASPSFVSRTLRGALEALTCRGWRMRIAAAPLWECPESTVERVVRWAPDALVVLGGGLRLDGQPNCATAERGFIAAQLFVALEGRPTLVFTGHGSRWIRRAVDWADARCIAARLEEQKRRQDDGSDAAALAEGGYEEVLPSWVRAQRAPREGERFAVSEAESLCAVMLRAVPESMRPLVLARARFDVRARDTVENARYTRAALLEAHSTRALVVSSPFIDPRSWTYHVHADRALAAFRGARRGAHYALGALACPRALRRAPWFELEPVEGYDGALRSRDARDDGHEREF